MTARNFWGWGAAARLPSADLSLMLAGALGARLGESRELVVAEPPDLAAIELEAPRVALPATLADVVSEDREERVRHTYGRAYPDILRGFRGDFRVAPDFVARPRNEQDLERIFAWAEGARVAVIPFGGGTSVVGGVEPRLGPRHRAALSLDLGAFGQVLELDPEARLARVQAGVLGPSLERQLAPSGLTLRHYPQSFEFSTVGGWIATRSGGHYATGPTHIDEFVAGLRTVTPRGVLESRCLPASGAGPSPDRLMLGSEGRLGVITEAWLRLTALPRYRSKVSVGFEAFEAAVDACRALVQSGLRPANARLLSAEEAQLFGVDGGARGQILLLGFESPRFPQDGLLGQALELLADHGGRALGPARHSGAEQQADLPSQSWKSAFFEAPYLQTGLVRVGLLADTFETCCRWGDFPALHARIERDVTAALRETGGAGLLSCRFTHIYPDGPAPYYTFITYAAPGQELEQWRHIKRAAGDALLAGGATITHHHAVGRIHMPWYVRQRPGLFGRMLAAARREVDPHGILNPGVLFNS